MQTRGILVLSASFLFATACGRGLEPGTVVANGTGRVIETPLTDAELARRGEEVVYRFRSVPNLVMLKAPSPSSGTPVVRSERVQEAARAHRKSFLLNSLPRPRMNLAGGGAGDGGFPFSEARFTEARRVLGPRPLAQVPVALLDSGVVPVTKPIQSILWKATNFTTENNPCEWQNHGTAIASLLSGVSLDVDEHHPCVVPTSDSLVEARQAAFAPNVKLHSIKISFDTDSLSSLRSDLGTLQLAVALDEAVASGARVVNLSFSYSQEEPPEEVRAVESLVMSHAAAKGVIFVVAAGNGGRRLDGHETFPARYGLENVVVVGAHDNHLRRAPASNFGDAVDLTAQGVSLPANTRTGQVMLFSGTSFSAPIVVSAIALYKGTFPAAPLRTVLEDLFSSADPTYAPAGNSLDLSSAPEDPNEVRPSRFGRLDVASYILKGMSRAATPVRDGS